MLDVAVFSNARFSAASASITAAFFALFGFIFTVTQYLQFVKGYNTLETGVRTLPFAVATGFAAPFAVKMVRKIGTKYVVAAGLATMAVGFLVTATFSATTTYTTIAASMVLLGGGLGLIMAPATESIMGSLPTEKAGVGSAVNDTTRQLGGTLGVAVIGSLFASAYGDKLTSGLRGLLPERAVTAARSSIGAAYAVADAAPAEARPMIRKVASDAFLSGFARGAIVTSGVALVGSFVALAFLPARSTTAEAADQPDVRPTMLDGSRGSGTMNAGSRHDFFTVIHKGQRKELFAATTLAGTINWEDVTAANDFVALWSKLTSMLEAHAAHEHKHFFPLLAQHAPEIVAQVETAHEDLDHELITLTDTIAVRSGQAEPRARPRRVSAGLRIRGQLPASHPRRRNHRHARHLAALHRLRDQRCPPRLSSGPVARWRRTKPSGDSHRDHPSGTGHDSTRSPAGFDRRKSSRPSWPMRTDCSSRPNGTASMNRLNKRRSRGQFRGHVGSTREPASRKRHAERGVLERTTGFEPATLTLAT